MPDRPDKPATAETRRDWQTFQQDTGEDASRTQRLRVGGGRWLIRTLMETGYVDMVEVDALFFGPDAMSATFASTDTRRDWETFQEDVGESKTQRMRIAEHWLVRTIMNHGPVSLLAADPLFFQDAA